MSGKLPPVTPSRKEFERLAESCKMNIARHTADLVDVGTGEREPIWHYNNSTTEKCWIWFKVGCEYGEERVTNAS